MLIFISFFVNCLLRKVYKIYKKTLLDNSQCNKVNKDNLKKKENILLMGLGCVGLGSKFIFVRLSHRLQLLPTI